MSSLVSLWAFSLGSYRFCLWAAESWSAIPLVTLVGIPLSGVASLRGGFWRLSMATQRVHFDCWCRTFSVMKRCYWVLLFGGAWLLFC